MNPIDKLRQMLTEADISFESYEEDYPPMTDPRLKSFFDVAYGEASKWQRNQIIYGRYNDNRRKFGWKIDAIYQRGSYGCTRGLLETYGTLGVDDKNNPLTMTPKEVFKIISDDWNKLSEKEKNALL